MKHPCIYEIDVKTFLKKVQENIKVYNYLNIFWLSIIEKRAKQYQHNYAEDYLLNPIVRWLYLNTGERLTALEQELKNLENILGNNEFPKYQKCIENAIVGISVENEAHNRMLDTRAEIRGMLYYTGLGYMIILEECKQIKKRTNPKTYDFNAISQKSNIAVEAKFIRLPDKLGQYIKRWWQAQAEITECYPLGYFPYTKFRWSVLNGDDLSLDEIEEIKKFLRSVFEKPDSINKLNHERINISYSPENKPLPATTPLGAIQEEIKKHPVDLLINKLCSTIENAKNKQLADAKAHRKEIACYFLLNLTSEISFAHEDLFREKLKCLQEKYKQCGLEVICEEANYL